MAYLTITRITGDPDRLLAGYRRSSDTMSAVGRDHGLILHSAAKTEEGLLIVNLWPSKEGSEAAGVTRAGSVWSGSTASSPDRIRPEHHEVADYVIFG